jgi:hypothetical protein
MPTAAKMAAMTTTFKTIAASITARITAAIMSVTRTNVPKRGCINQNLTVLVFVYRAGGAEVSTVRTQARRRRIAHLRKTP